VFVFSGDDPVTVRDQNSVQPRDNVLFEYGLFAGTLPEHSVVFVRMNDARTASDLNGITYIDATSNGLDSVVESKVGDWLDQLIQRRAVIQAAKIQHNLLSSYPLLELRTDETKVARVNALSADCKRFFGRDSIAPDDLFFGMKAEELMRRLEAFVDPPAQYWEDLTSDQAMVYERFKLGFLPLAHVGVRFNESHPFFARKTFVPLIVEQRKSADASEDLTRIMYLDISTLPRHVFGEGMWALVREGTDLQKLATELLKMVDELGDATPERCEALKDAAREASKGGSPRILELCSEVGLFSMLRLAKTGNHQEALRLLDWLLDPIDPPSGSL
jgi:Predicted nucleotide-binding protein containing TIR-like domain